MLKIDFLKPKKEVGEMEGRTDLLNDFFSKPEKENPKLFKRLYRKQVQNTINFISKTKGEIKFQTEIFSVMKGKNKKRLKQLDESENYFSKILKELN